MCKELKGQVHLTNIENDMEGCTAVLSGPEHTRTASSIIPVAVIKDWQKTT